MKKRTIALVLAAAALSGCAEKGGKSSKKTELTVLAAASLTEACNEIERLYESRNSDTDLLFSYGGSGALQKQIEEGAPADVFFSAAKKQMNALIDEELVDKDTVNELLENKIVLIVPEGNLAGVKGFDDVISDNVAVIGLGEPSSVPVGQYSEEIFDHLGILDAVSRKASYASDVKQVLSWVEAGNADCGVVYSTDANCGEGIAVICEAPENSHNRVIYPAGLVSSSNHKEEAKAFLSFLESGECRDIFEKYGFTALKEQG